MHSECNLRGKFRLIDRRGLFDYRVGRGLRQYAKRLARLARLLEQAGQGRPRVQAEREGPIPLEGGTGRGDGVRKKVCPLERSRAQQKPVGLESDRRRRDIPQARRGRRVVAAPRVVGREEQGDASVPSRPLRGLADRLENRLPLRALAVLEQIGGACELGVEIGGDLEVGESPAR